MEKPISQKLGWKLHENIIIVWLPTKVVKNLPDNSGDVGCAGLIPGSGRSPGRKNGNLHQYFCLENPMDSGVWWPTAHGFATSQT